MVLDGIGVFSRIGKEKGVAVKREKQERTLPIGGKVSSLTDLKQRYRQEAEAVATKID